MRYCFALAVVVGSCKLCVYKNKNNYNTIQLVVIINRRLNKKQLAINT